MGRSVMQEILIAYTMGLRDQYKISETKKKKNRTRKITWYTPPYNQSVKTNITKEFLKILDKSFPADNPLRKIFNKNTVKISYSTTRNISSIIASHNRKLLNPKTNNKQEMQLQRSRNGRYYWYRYH